MLRIFKISVVLLILGSQVAFACGQNDTTTRKPRHLRDSIPPHDVLDLMHQFLHLGSSGSQHDSVGRKPIFSMVPAAGYALQSRMAILISGNVAFRLADNARISVVNFSSSYSQNAQFTLPLLWSAWTNNNTFNLVGDLRFYAYPQSTFGLGSNTAIHDPDPMNYNYFRFSEAALRHITGNLYLGAGYILDDHWGISHQLPINVTYPSFVNFYNSPHTVSSGFTLNGVFDSRDCSINPSRGFYASYQIRENMTALGSTAAWSSLILDVRKYFRFPASSDNVLAFWSYDSVTLSGDPPYLDLPSTLWDTNTNAGRGYIQGRFRGAQMVYAESEYRYGITRDGLLGGVFFVNVQSFSAAPGTHLQSFQPGYGPGIRIKLNKVSKTNICMDYGFGTQGSHGLFVNIGELF